jgi:hypothetical protein
MSGTTFPSNPCYLPIYRDGKLPGSIRYTDIWSNFYHDTARRTSGSLEERTAERIREYNGRVVNDVVVFETEQDKMWFILKWS